MLHYKNLSLINLSEEVDGIVYYERWRPVKGFEGLYKVSDFGRVKSLVFKLHKREKILKQSFQKSGYLFVTLYDRCGGMKIINTHRLVGVAFIKNPKNKPEINHKHSLKADNRFHQLEWNTKSENGKHSYATGLRVVSKNMLGKFGKLHHNSKPVFQYDLNGVLIKEHEGTRDAERNTGITQISISRAARLTIKTAGGYKWSYANNN